MITIEQFFMGRDKTYASELTQEIRDNAAETVDRVNRLIAIYVDQTGDARPRKVTSGWRPPAVNAGVANAAKRSNHMLGKACDVADASKSLKIWLMTEAGQIALEDCGLWIEHPSATPTWAHFQTVPPKSGRRVFHP